MHRPSCDRKGCDRARPDRVLLLNRRKPPRFDEKEFCSQACLELHVESELVDRWQSMQRRTPPRLPRPKIGAILLQSGTITPSQLDRALALQRDEGRGRIGEWLVRLGTLTERQITLALSRQYGLPVINLRDGDAPSEAVRMLPGRIARRFGSLPVGLDEGRETLQIAVTPPLGVQTQDAMRRMTGKALSVFIGDQSRVRRLIDLWYEDDLDRTGEEMMFRDLEDLVAIARATAIFACESRAATFQIELVEDCLWTRMDYAGGALHRVCRKAADASPAPAPNDRVAAPRAAAGA